MRTVNLRVPDFYCIGQTKFFNRKEFEVLFYFGMSLPTSFSNPYISEVHYAILDKRLSKYKISRCSKKLQIRGNKCFSSRNTK